MLGLSESLDIQFLGPWKEPDSEEQEKGLILFGVCEREAANKYVTCHGIFCVLGPLQCTKLSSLQT